MEGERGCERLVDGEICQATISGIPTADQPPLRVSLTPVGTGITGRRPQQVTV